MEYITEIIIAALALVGSVLGSYSGFRLTAYRVDQLEKKVDQHNNFAARIPILERDITDLRKDLENLKGREKS